MRTLEEPEKGPRQIAGTAHQYSRDVLAVPLFAQEHLEPVIRPPRIVVDQLPVQISIGIKEIVVAVYLLAQSEKAIV